MQGGEGTVGRLDVIALRGISAQAVHGVLKKEWNAPQSFSADILLWVDTDQAALSDDIADTVSYAEIAEKAHAILRGPSVRLIETLGHRIADVAMEDERVRGVEVTIHKPDAPIDVPFADVSVTIRKGNIPLPFVAASHDLPFDGPNSEEEKSAPPSGPIAPETGADEECDTPSAGVETVAAPSAESDAVAPSETTSEIELPAEPVKHSHRGAYAVDDCPPTCDVVLAFGGNLGNVPVTLKRAIEEISQWDNVDITTVSPLVRTRAVLRPGQDAQPDYWNAVALGTISLAPLDLLDRIHELEARLGRVRHEVWGARTIDIDVIDIKGVTSDDPRLTLPHPRAHERAFVLSPWLMADENAELSGYGPLADLIAQAPDRGGILDAVADWMEDPESVIADSDELLEELRLPRLEQAEKLRPLKLETNGISARPSRLDMLPEASRSDLAPDDEGTDFVWKQLWNRWSSPVDSVESRHVELSKPAVSQPSVTPAPATAASFESTTGDRPSEETDSSVPPSAASSNEAPIQLASRQVPAPAPLNVPPLKLSRLSAQADSSASTELTEGMVSLAPRRPIPTAQVEQPTVVRRPLFERVQSREFEIPSASLEVATETPMIQSAEPLEESAPSTSPITAEVPLSRRKRRPRWRPVTEEGTGISTANSPRPFRARTDRLAAQSHRAKPSHRAPESPDSPSKAAQKAPSVSEANAPQPRRSSLFSRRPEQASAQEKTKAQGDAQAQDAAASRRAPATRALPGWTFSEDVRVVDDSSALTPREATSTTQPSLPPRYSHVLDPKLADTIDQGPAQETGPQTPSSSVRRNVTIRPSVTGQIPVFRRRPEDS